MDRLQVATLNILHILDRWPERLPLILADMAALQPDVVGLQEVVYAIEQDRVIAAAGRTRYAIHRGWAGRPEYGNSLLVRDDLATAEDDRVDLGVTRAASRVVVALPSGGRLTAAVVHLHHLASDPAIRDAQTRALIEWLDDGPPSDGLVVVGDFNATPDEPAYERMVAGGFRSAHLEANGTEPDVTWPSGLATAVPDPDSRAGCIDYIWIRGAVAADSCRLVFDRPAIEDPTLYPSDHRGLAAMLRVGG